MKRLRFHRRIFIVSVLAILFNLPGAELLLDRLRVRAMKNATMVGLNPPGRYALGIRDASTKLRTLATAIDQR
jgi:hypothetical protein